MLLISNTWPALSLPVVIKTETEAGPGHPMLPDVQGMEALLAADLGAGLREVSLRN